ncbi:hypothetical protein [Saccharothrix australiensis]|uniref:Subtilisin inhibitor-like n=1 Tax=Saccharothrix australiensis TaxID=2072 RepID=A0A495VZB4_9PSEU|nr:hypothetical protein [Saccharothrix australiensis]RKT54782.1 hypothetical protein C8E97_3431 [Saccharothrix australiensis]
MSIGNRKALVAVFAFSTMIGGGVAAADSPPRERVDQKYTCNALTSASVPEVRLALVLSGINPAEAKGPVGLACTVPERVQPDGGDVHITGIEDVVFTCGKADLKKENQIVFFDGCKS